MHHRDRRTWFFMDADRELLRVQLILCRGSVLDCVAGLLSASVRRGLGVCGASLAGSISFGRRLESLQRLLTPATATVTATGTATAPASAEFYGACYCWTVPVSGTCLSGLL